MREYEKILKSAKTVLWNGPLGVNEVPLFAQATTKLARVIARQSGHALTIAGGGETMEVIDNARLRRRFDFCSTGGGAMLEFLEGKKLPGIVPLMRK
jgi:phosphoglycerate kinase